MNKTSVAPTTTEQLVSLPDSGQNESERSVVAALPPGSMPLPVLPRFGASDYVQLPDCGVGHYSLTDAAIVAALDFWASGNVPDLPFENWEDDQDDPKVRAALEPLRGQIFQALVRSVAAGQLEAVVLGRRLADGSLIPERTFVDLHDLSNWLNVYGHEPGEFIADLLEELQGEPWDVAEAVAQDRAALRHSHLVDVQSGRLSDDTWEPMKERSVAEEAEHKLHLMSLYALQLEEQSGKSGKMGVSDKLTSTRQRRTLLTLIAALCKKAGIDPLARGAAIAIASATEELGTVVGDDTIRAILREIPDALESRSR